MQLPKLNMDKFQLHYSEKNIPVPPQDSFLKCLISKTGNFINRIHWKAFFFDQTDETSKDEVQNKFGFKTENSPPSNTALSNFESDLYDLISHIKFRKIDNDFQNKLNKDIQKIRNSDKVIVAADKSSNLYKMSTVVGHSVLYISIYDTSIYNILLFYILYYC